MEKAPTRASSFANFNYDWEHGGAWWSLAFFMGKDHATTV